MSTVLERVTRRIGGRPIVQDVSLEIADGELFVLLGPSGGGKSTILRMIAGLSPVDSGRILLHGRDVTGVPPQDRGVGFVFQNYALFRHMTAAENIAFALKVRGASRQERTRRADELLELVGLTGLGRRYPRQLSGGQQQRVALARALAHRPEILLLDEPFGALDVRIREDVRRSVRRIQRELGVTTVFVTHDQEEAFELADRVGLLDGGRLVEVASPRELYLRPRTEFGARFVGAANILVAAAGSEVLHGAPDALPEGLPNQAERPLELVFRPEDVAVKNDPDAVAWPTLGRAVVESTHFCGSYEKLRLRLPAIPGVRAIVPPPDFGDDTLVVEAHRSGHQAWRYPLVPGSEAWVGVRRIHAVDHHALRFALIDDGSEAAAAASSLLAAIAGPGYSDVTVLAEAARLRPELGALPRVRRASCPADAAQWQRLFADEKFDVVVAGHDPAQGVASLLALHRAGAPSLLVVPAGARPAPGGSLIAATASTFGRTVVGTAGRVLRHLKWPATLFSGIEAHERGTQAEQRTAEFLSGGRRSLALLGIEAATQFACGPALHVLDDELARGAYALLVLGHAVHAGKSQQSFGPLVTHYLEAPAERALLIVRHTVAPRAEAS